MSRIRTAMLLSFILVLLSPTLGHAEVWRCSQPGGPDLFTDTLKDPRTCQKYELRAPINFVPSSSTTTLPEVAPSQPLPVAEPPAPPEARREVSKRPHGETDFEVFRQISTGITKQEVLSLAGPPAVQYVCETGGRCLERWVYYYDDKWVAEISFYGRTGRVANINNYRRQ